MKRQLLHAYLISCVVPWGLTASGMAAVNVERLTAEQIASGYMSGQFSVVEVTQAYLDRIRAFEPSYNAFTYLNQDALSEAVALDEELQTNGARGPLHGVPVVIKESMDLSGVPSTAAYAGFSSTAGGVDLIPDTDAPVVARLRDAGAIILGKTNIPPFSSYSISSDSDRTTSSWDGPTYNAHDRRLVPGGSSSGTGTAVAADFAALGLGEDTAGSIQNPAAAQGIVAVKPTFGLIPNTGITPIAASTRDTVGPMAKTVWDAGLALDVLAGYTPDDPKTTVAQGQVPAGGYTSQMTTTALQGKRIGLFGPGWNSRLLTPETQTLFDQAVSTVNDQGAIIVEDPFAGSGFNSLIGSSVSGLESIVYDFEKYLERLGPGAAANSLAELEQETGEDIFSTELSWVEFFPVAVQSLQDPDIPPDLSEFFAARAQFRQVFNQVMDAHQLDAVIFPQRTGALPHVLGQDNLESITGDELSFLGAPLVTVPAGYHANGSPFGLLFAGRLFDEAALLGLAYDFEQAAQARQPAPLTHNPVWPSALIQTDDEAINAGPDGAGDTVSSVESLVFSTIGDIDLSGSNRDSMRRLTLRFELPDRPESATSLESASLRFSVARLLGEPGPIQVFHSVDDNAVTESPTLYEDARYLDTGIVLTNASEMINEMLELDVTELVRSDYLSDGESATSAFRLQLMVDFVADDTTAAYRIHLLGGELLAPELIMTFLPERSIGNLNNDRSVDAADASILFTNWGSVPPGDPIADINGDGLVDAADAAEIFTNWTGDSQRQSVPERSSALLLTLASLGAITCRRIAAR